MDELRHLAERPIHRVRRVAARHSCREMRVVAPSGVPPNNGASMLTSRLRELHPRRFFLDTWRTLNEEAVLEREALGGATDYRPFIAFSVGCVCLALMEYMGHRDMGQLSVTSFTHMVRWIDETFETSWYWNLRGSKWDELAGFVWWSLWRVLGFFIIPVLVVKYAFKGSLKDYGLETKGFSEHAWIYGLFYGIVLVLVIGVSFSKEFTSYYPFYKNASRSWFDFVSWELLYAAQFFSLEFFFRGFLVFACKRSMGAAAIAAMVAPYCMIHFGKPFIETLGAIIAGVVLGTLAMRTRSIWSGFLIHVSVAVTMDAASLLQGVGLPKAWFP